ncbi:MAG: hypothetical protein K5686_05745 [Lachnospiraceae bacterium]|nr:hypothetical protein [Lachnospiraceae bacterium]
MVEEQDALPQRIEQGYYSYPDEDAAGEAANELEKIRRLEAQIDYNKPKVVYALYNKMLLGEVFSTPEGFAYLLHLRQYLEDHVYDIGEAVPGIPVEMFIHEKIQEVPAGEEKNPNRRKKKDQDTLSYKIIITALALLVIAMLVITALSDSPTILNYEKKLQDRYASWEMELAEREDAIRAKELELKKGGE